MSIFVTMQTNNAIAEGIDWTVARQCLGQHGRLSVILPVYRLAPVIGGNISRVCRLLRGNLSFEVIPVDDGSDDASRAELSRIADDNPEVQPVFLARNTGKGAALREGFLRSKGSHVLLLDADLDLPPEQIGIFFSIMAQKGVDIVIGSKRHPQSEINYPAIRRLSSRVYYGIVKMLFGLPVRDTQTGIKLFKREALACAFDRMLVKRFAFDLEVLAIAHHFGFGIAEAPIKMEFGTRVGCLSWKAVREVMHDTMAVFYRLRLLRYYQSLEPVCRPLRVPSFTVVVNCHGNSPQLAHCLEGLFRQKLPPREILIVVDQGFALGDTACRTGAGASPPGPKIRVIPCGRATPAAKRNLGITAATGDVVAFIDDDAVPGENWLDRASICFSNQDIAAVGGPSVPASSNEPFMARISGRVMACRLVTGGVRFRYVPDRVREVDELPACNLMVRASVLADIGGFCPDQYPGEDTMLCLDVRRKPARRIVYDPWLIVVQHRPPLFKAHLRQIACCARQRGCLARRLPELRRCFQYQVPSLFLMSLAGGLFLAVFWPSFRFWYLSALALYLIATLLSSAHGKPRVWLMTWLGILSTHLVYGLFFLRGFATPSHIAHKNKIHRSGTTRS